MTDSSDELPPTARNGPLRFRVGDMPAIFGDTAAALVVDDDEQLASVLNRLLSREGYVCTIASNAAQARARLAESRFAVALIDVMMPGESGLELAADLLAHTPDLAVVMVTGVDDPHLAELALESGAYGYVVKPFRPSQVVITVANAGRRRCLEIERRLYRQQLHRRVDDQAADLDDALRQLKELAQHDDQPSNPTP
ncbi:MAG: cyclic di-GMP phosphodiesterase [Acidimicrobiaceae bacterium]|jgi:DNA-binding NtrC family response regulator